MAGKSGIQLKHSPVSDMTHTPKTPRAEELHTPVMLDECIEYLAPALTGDRPVVVDATLGMGGHTEALLRRFASLTVIGLDRDQQALQLAGARLAEFGDRFIPVHSVFDGFADAVAAAGFNRIDGALFDLGVSSLQLDDADRGFAYAQDAPLDMRMDQSAGRTAADLIAEASEQELADIFRTHGDEPLAKRYARAIVAERGSAPVVSSAQLVDILQEATPAKLKSQRHPAKRVFQALRVAVNNELEAIAGAVPQALELLRVGGRIVVMSYQSHEDRIVKRLLVEASSSTAPRGLPVELPEHQAEFRLLTRGAQRANQTEQTANPRAIPARLRAAERVKEAS